MITYRLTGVSEKLDNEVTFYDMEYTELSDLRSFMLDLITETVNIKTWTLQKHEGCYPGWQTIASGADWQSLDQAQNILSLVTKP